MSLKRAATLMGIGLTVATLFGFSQEARAGGNDYCREYTRTVYIGGRTQEAYGTACQQPDGSWMIVGEGTGNDIRGNVSDVDYVIHDGRRDLVPTRVVYYDRNPVVYRTRPAPLFIWYNNSDRYYRNGHYVNYTRYNNGWNNRHDRHDRWDRDDDRRGRGRGHDRD